MQQYDAKLFHVADTLIYSYTVKELIGVRSFSESWNNYIETILRMKRYDKTGAHKLCCYTDKRENSPCDACASTHYKRIDDSQVTANIN